MLKSPAISDENSLNSFQILQNLVSNSPQLEIANIQKMLASYGEVILVPSLETLPPRKRHRLFKSFRTPVAQQPQAQQFDLLERLQKAYPVKVTKPSEVLELLSAFPQLNWILSSVMKALLQKLSSQIQFELALDQDAPSDSRLTLIVRQSVYQDDIFEQLASYQAAIDPIATIIGHRLFLTSDFGTIQT